MHISDSKESACRCSVFRTIINVCYYIVSLIPSRLQVEIIMMHGLKCPEDTNIHATWSVEGRGKAVLITSSSLNSKY